MELPREVREAFRAQGRRGGRARARALPPAARRRIAAEGALARWMRMRFGAARLAELQVPGGDLVDKGISDLAAWTVGETETLSREALLVALAAPRLREEGIPLPIADLPADADHRLYDALEREDPEAAHARYNALLRRITSLSSSLPSIARRSP